MITLVLLLFCSLATAQEHLDAFVRIIDNNDQAGEVGIYRFTLELIEGVTIQTYLPSSVQYMPEDPSSTEVDICREFLISHTNPLENCVFDSSQNMIQFTLPEGSGSGFFIYELGYLKNPAFSQSLTGFLIKVLDSSSNTIYQSNEFLVFVAVKPNVLREQSLQVSSEKVAELSTYTFKFKVTNPVPEGGFIDIQFPLNHIDVPDDIQGSRIKIYSESWTDVSYSLTQNGIEVMVPSPGIAGAESADPSLSVQLEIQGIKNPSTMESTDSFSLRTLIPARKVIDEVDTGLVVRNTIPAEIQIEDTTIYKKTVGQTTMMTIKLLLPTVYSSGGYIIMSLPDTVSINSAMLECFLHIGFETDQGKCSMLSDGQIKLFDNIKQEALTFTIQGIVNPPNTKPTESFVFRAYDAFDNLIADSLDQLDVTYTPTPGTLSQVSASRQDPVVGAIASSENEISFEFRTKNRLQNNEIVQIVVPTTELLLLTDLECLTQGPEDDTPVLNTCPVVEEESNFTFQFPVNCDLDTGCAPSSLIKVVLKGGVSNLRWILMPEHTNSIEIRTWTQDMLYLIDTKLSDVFIQPDLQEGSLTGLLLDKVEGKVGEETEFDFEMTLQNELPASGIVQMTFEFNTLQTPFTSSSLECSLEDGSPVVCSYESFSGGEDYVMNISLEDPCFGPCASGSTHKFNIKGLRNPKSVKPLAALFDLRTFTTEGYAIDKGVITNATGLTIETASLVEFVQIQPNLDTDTVITGAAQTYSFKITPKNQVMQSLGLIEIMLPPEVSLVDSGACAAHSEDLQVFLSCEMSVPTNTISLYHNSNRDFVSESIVVKLQNAIKNPPSTKPSAYVPVITYLRDIVDMELYEVDTDFNSVQLQANTPNTLSATVERSADQVSVKTSLTVCFTPFNNVQPNSLLTIKVPEDQALFDLSKEQTVKTFPDLNSLAIVSQTGQEMVVVHSNAITEDEVCLLVEGGIRNPDSTKPPTQSFEISIKTSDHYQVDEKKTGIFAQPYLSAGPFKSVTIESTGDVIGQETTIQVTVVVSSALQSGSQLNIDLPTSLFYELTGQDVRCDSNTCSYVATESDSFGNYISQVQHVLNQAQSEGDTVTFTISGVLNKFTTERVEESDLLSTVKSIDPNDYVINTSTTTVLLPDTFQHFPGALVVTATRSELTIQRPTSLTLQLQTGTRLQNGSFITVYLARSLFMNQFLLSPHCLVDSQVTSCSSDPLRESAEYFAVTFKLDCQVLCPAGHLFELRISQFENALTTFRQSTNEVFYQSYDAQNANKVESSAGDKVFDDELEPFSVEADVASFSVSSNTVGAVIDYRQTITYEGVVQAGSHINFEFRPILTDATIGKYGPFLRGESDQTSLFTIAGWNEYQYGQLTLVSFAYKIQNSHQDSIVVEVPSGFRNLNFVAPLNFNLVIEIKDFHNTIVATGTTEFRDIEYLEPAILERVQLHRGNRNLNQRTELRLSLGTKDFGFQNGIDVSLLVPTTEIEISDQACESIKQGFPAIPVTCVKEYTQDNQFVKLDFTNVICEKDCFSQNEFTLQVEKGVKNPPNYFVQKDSASISVTYYGYEVAETAENMQIFVVPPLEVQPFEVFKVTQSSNATSTGSETTFEISFKLDNPVPDNSDLIFKLPPETVLYSAEKPVCKGYKTDEDQEPQTFSCLLKPFQRQSKGHATYTSHIEIFSVGSIGAFSGEDITLEISNIFNVEFNRHRQFDNNFELVVMSPSKTALVASSYSESYLPDFKHRITSGLKVTRGSTDIGEERVEYTFDFKTPNYISQGSYFQIKIPLADAIVNERDLDCEDSNTRRRLDCSVLKNQIVIVPEGCGTKSGERGCEVNQDISLVLKLNNRNTLAVSDQDQFVNIIAYNAKDEAIVEITSDSSVTPPLTGLELDSLQVVRRENKLGEQTFLKFFIPSLPASIYTETDLVLQLPRHFAYVSEPNTPRCQRRYYDDQPIKTVDLPCQIYPRLSSEVFDKKEVAQVSIESVCNQYDICQANSHLTIEVMLENPGTNLMQESTQLKYILEQKGFDIGMTVFDTSTMPKMLSNHISVSTQIGSSANDECLMTAKQCPITFDLVTTNPIQSDTGHLKVRIPEDLQLMSQKCQAYVETKGLARNEGKVFMPTSCTITSNREVWLRVEQRLSDMIQTSSHVIRLTLSDVLQPETTKPTSEFVVESFEKLSNGRMSLVDTNREDSEGYAVPRGSPFNFIKVERVGSLKQKETTQLKVSLQTRFFNIIEEVEQFNLLIKLPPSEAMLQREVGCITSTGLQFSQQCSVVSDQTLKVHDFDKFCPEPSHSCEFTITNVVNPELVSLEQHQELDSVDVTLVYLSKDENEYAIHQSKKGVFVTPAVELTSLELADPRISSPDSDSSQSSLTAEPVQIDFIVSAQDSATFTDKALLIEFSKGSQLYKPQLSRLQALTASVNGKSAGVLAVKHTDNYIDSVLIENSAGGKSFSIQLSNINNPDYVDNYNIKCSLSVYLVEQSDRDFVAAYATQEFDSNLKANDFVSLDLFSSKPWPNSHTSVDVAFSMLPKVSSGTTQVAFEFQGADFEFNNKASCQDLFSDQKPWCFQNKGDSVVHVNYLNYQGPASSAIQYTAFGFNFGPLSNPGQLGNYTVAISVYEGFNENTKVYARDTTVISVVHFAASCPDDCHTCTTHGRCTTCKSPSELPILNQDGRCVSTCTTGYFLSNGMCLSCPEDCLTCQTAGQCSSCSNHLKFADGRCLESCPVGTSFDLELKSCTKIQSTSTQTLPVLYSEDVISGSCENKDCESCGMDPGYCLKCKHEFSVVDGQCINGCPQGYFSSGFAQQCYKCNSVCKECEQNANQCTSCFDTDSIEAEETLFTQTMLAPEFGQCVSECAPGTFYSKTNKRCEMCGHLCNTCESYSSKCTSCFFDKTSQYQTDLFHIEKEFHCKTECPWFMVADWTTHKCQLPQVAIIQSIGWPLILLAVLLTLSTIFIVISRVKSEKKDRPYHVAACAFAVSDFINRILFWGWTAPTTSYLVFCLTGIIMVSNVLMGIYFWVVVVGPVQFALIMHKPDVHKKIWDVNGHKVMEKLRWVAFAAGPCVFHLLTSNFCNKLYFNIEFDRISPAYYMYMQRNLLGNTVWMAYLQVCVGVWAVFDFGLAGSASGLGLNSIVLGVITIVVQTRLMKDAEKELKKYKMIDFGNLEKQHIADELDLVDAHSRMVQDQQVALEQIQRSNQGNGRRDQPQ